ncbi:MAG: hypothetical protein AB2L11_13760 [Syntrophobacteraceae bacterium]
MLTREISVLGWMVWGAMAGVAGAFFATRGARNFRMKLLSGFDLHIRSGTAVNYASGILKHREKWKKSVSLIRKPFSKHINFAIETAALIYAGTGLVNSIVKFESVFNHPLKGMGVIIFLSAVMAYIPAEWFFSGKTEKEMDAVLYEMETAIKDERLESYIAEAKKNWV